MRSHLYPCTISMLINVQGISRFSDDKREDTLHEDSDNEESQINMELAHPDDVFATSGELRQSDIDLYWDLPELSESPKADDLSIPHSDSLMLDSPAPGPMLFGFASDDQRYELHDDDGYETDTSSTLLDDVFAYSGELPFSDTEAGDSEYDTAPEPESHDRYTGRSRTTLSTHSQNVPKLDLEDVFTVGDQHQDIELLPRSPSLRFSQLLSWPGQANAQFKPEACSTSREDMLVYSCLASGS